MNKDGVDLTGRELEIMAFASEGLSSADIAGMLKISAATVRSHLSNAAKKLGATNTANAVALAIRGGLLPGSPSARTMPLDD